MRKRNLTGVDQVGVVDLFFPSQYVEKSCYDIAPYAHPYGEWPESGPLHPLEPLEPLEPLLPGGALVNAVADQAEPETLPVRFEVISLERTPASVAAPFGDVL